MNPETGVLILAFGYCFAAIYGLIWMPLRIGWMLRVPKKKYK